MQWFHKFILAWNSTCFGQFVCPIIRSLFTVHSAMVYKPVWHIPLLNVQWINSWWWTEELSETCRVLCQNKFVKLLHLFGFTKKKFVTMHGYMNVKNYNLHAYGSSAKDRSNWSQLSNFWNARKKVKVKQERESSSDIASRNRQDTYGDFGTSNAQTGWRTYSCYDFHFLFAATLLLDLSCWFML